MRKIECFKIRLLAGQMSDTWDVKKLRPIHEICNNRHPLSLNPVVIVADPFLFVHQDRLFLFYEEKRNYSNGILRMTCTEDLMEWTEPVTVLEEPFHLSYPFVFEENGVVYMIPETSDIGDIRLYKADNDALTHFSHYQTLVSKDVVNIEIGYADSSVFKKEGTYYLITSMERQRINYLYLFTSDSLEGPYKEHPMSPVSISAKYGRNGGSLLEWEGGIYRVAQDCELRYGDNVHLFQIDEMTTTSYKEHITKSSLIPTDDPFYQEGGHQFNFVDFKGHRIVATDAKEYRYYRPYRLLHKSGLILRKLFKK